MRRALLLLLLALATLPCAAQEAGTPQKLEAIRLNAGMHLISAELARTPQQRAVGLMHRRELGANAGMLFVFEQPGRQCFWMKNTPLPLSIAFLKDDGEVVDIADMQPNSLQLTCSASPVRVALEMNQGWFAKRGIKPGSRLGGGPFGR
ncbi:MAG TPA: DUF192 domain-containing protein [Methylibium sp.]|nr:DUF192 domain-containing protein [Methylibium sp.]